ncbi:Cof-type HAD-IIB family hydrolase [Domibacillus indicus]|uniref:Cof-type HAD-IIB family hydrolase n=1 Tax=Domibacillus indicus TaxID=1437523 RepID=UPI0006180F65|nr:Cof-type HAD-IIB family hydrolase [Domibacillus indicus]
MELIAIDLNGTLLNRRNTISRKNVEAIKWAQEKGTEIVIATRRAYFDVQSILARNGISAWIIGANGATIHSSQGQLLFEKSLEQRDAEDIIHYIDKENMYYEISSREDIYTVKSKIDLLTIEMYKLKNRNPKINLRKLEEVAERQFSQKNVHLFSTTEEALEKAKNCYALFGVSFHTEKLTHVLKGSKKRETVTALRSGKYLCEFTHADVSKGNALKHIAWKLNVSNDKIAAIGNDENDFSMFNFAGMAIAMGNADKKVKSSASYITACNDKDGVAHIIRHLIKE